MKIYQEEDTETILDDELTTYIPYVYRINKLWSEFMSIYEGMKSFGTCTKDTYRFYQYYLYRIWYNVIEPIPHGTDDWHLSVTTPLGVAGMLHSLTKDTCQLILEVPDNERGEVKCLLQQIAPRYKHLIF